jgi:hypothetical protein
MRKYLLAERVVLKDNLKEEKLLCTETAVFTHIPEGRYYGGV